MNAALLQLFGGLYALPRGSNFDEYTVDMNALGLLQLNDPFAAREGADSVKAQTRIDFG